VKLPSDYCLLKVNETPRATVRDVYNAACEQDGFTGPESPSKMFFRTARFLYAYWDQLNRIQRDILTSAGLLDSAVPATMADLRDLTVEEALRLSFVVMAIEEAARVFRHFNKVLVEWNKKEWAEPERLAA